MKITLGFSPCPNDTFIFDALVNHKIDTGDFSFEVVLEDVQTLNRWALDGKLDMSKISYGVLPLVLPSYIVLPAGGALGKGVGPLLIARKDFDAGKGIKDCSIAIPGENTTANLLFSLAYPMATKKHFLLFSDIEDAVVQGKTNLGVIIHENRFTYMNKGLQKIVDLGEFWEQQTQGPIPLGGIVMKRSFDVTVQEQVSKLLQKSVAFAFKNYPLLADYVRDHSQEMEESVMRQHIDLYVNSYSEDLGENGKRAVEKLLSVYGALHPETSANELTVFAEVSSAAV